MIASERETDVMARKTVKIEIPAGKPEDLMTLAENLVEQHTELGKESPLDTDRIKELDDAVKPVTYASPAASSAIPKLLSSLLPPR